MIPIDQYKTLREKLDELLIEYDIPKEHFHDSGWLNANIRKLFFQNTENEAAEAEDLDRFICKILDDVERTLIYIHKLCPYPLTRLYEDINYDRILN